MASKSLLRTEASTVWQDSGGDKVMDIQGLISNLSEIGAYLDLGASPRSDFYEVEVFIDGFNGSSPVGRGLNLFFSQSNETTGFDGPPTTDPTSSAIGAITNNQSFNCLYVGYIRNHTTGSTSVLQCRFVVRLTGRYVAPVLRSYAVSTVHSSNIHKITLTPIPQEAQ